MSKIFLRTVIAILFGASVYACRPTPLTLPTNTPPLPVASPTATTLPTPVPTLTSTPAAVIYPGWITYPEYKSIKGMVFDQKGNLWAAGPGGLVLLQPDGTQRSFTMKDGLPSDDLLSIGMDAREAIWVGSRGGGVARFDGKSWQTFTTADGLAGNDVFSIGYINSDPYELIFGTQNGLSMYNGRWITFAGPSYLPDDEIRAMTTLLTGSLWVGTKKGVTWFGPSETFTTADGLANNVVNAMAIAPDCSMWVGTSQGVSHYSKETWTSNTTADGLAADWVSAIAVALDGAVWFGTRSGVSRFDGQTWTTYTTADGLADNDVLSIAIAPDGTLWFGTAGGLSHYSPSLETHPEELDKSLEGTLGNSSTLQMVYLKDGNLWLWNQGMKSQLTREGRVISMTLSEDGSKVAFIRLNGKLENELWVINQDGSDEHQLVGPDDLAALADLNATEPSAVMAREVVIFNYAWIPGQHTIAFGTRRYLEEAGTRLHDDLRLVDTESGEITTLIPLDRGGMFSYSPDGSQIAIVTPNNLSIMNADGSHLRSNLVEYPNVRTYSEYEYYPHPIWSADSKFVLLVLPPHDPMEIPPQPTMLWRIPADGSPATLMGSIFPAQFFAFSAAFTPDFTQIAYLTDAGELNKNNFQLHLANIDGTSDNILQEGFGLRFESWSPDGQHYIYTQGVPRAWYIGSIDGDSTPLNFHPENLVWVNAESFLHFENLGCALELSLSNLNGESLVIDRMWKLPVIFDFVIK